MVNAMAQKVMNNRRNNNNDLNYNECFAMVVFRLQQCMDCFFQLKLKNIP